MLFWSAFIMGLVSNLHCLGMCGPLALSVPQHPKFRITGILLYNAGRILIYALLGALFGFIGSTFKIIGFQNVLSITIGISLVIAAFYPKLLKARGFLSFPLQKIRHWLSVLFKKKTLSSIFFIGTLNGLLPCGMVYFALAGAVATSHWYAGSLFMLLFGMGTTPIMIALPFMGKFISFSWKLKLRKLVPGFLLFFGLLLIARGSGLGIPFISPKINAENTAHMSCH